MGLQLNIMSVMSVCIISCNCMLYLVLVELHNSQVLVKGCETPGFVIISAAWAKIASCVHIPIWRSNQLRSKSSWTANVDCMQVVCLESE